jgi:phosphoglycerate kinase
MRSIEKLNNIEGKRVLVRVDWNVPIQNGDISNDFRIRKSLPTLELLISKGAKVLLITHLEPKETSFDLFQKYVPSGVELLPNLRLNPGEEANSKDFAKSLAAQADIYVNEAFSVSHRSHASIIGVPELLPAYAGLQFSREVAVLSRSFNPPRPFLLILGGVKFETKLPIVQKFLPILDSVFIGGGMANAATKTSLAKDPKVLFTVGDITALDINPETLALLQEKIQASKFILWNGPVGNYENGYTYGTLGLAKVLAQSGKEVIVGGGDTLSAIRELNLEDKFTFVSTGGGAMLDFLANGTLPGIKALR